MKSEHMGFKDWQLPVLLAVVLALSLGTALAGSNSTLLPGGTEITVTIDDPVSSTRFLVPPGETADVDVTGTASVAEGVAVPDTGIVYATDGSGSTAADSGGDCGPEQNPLDPETVEDEIIDCEIAAVISLNDEAIALGSVAEVAMLMFAGDAVTADATPAGGDDAIIAPDANANANAENDVDEVMHSIEVAEFLGEDSRFNEFTIKDTPDIFGTDFADAASEACTVAGSMLSSTVIVAFLSDGTANAGADVTTVLPCGTVVFHTFAVGAGADCDSDPSGRGSLQEMADLTGGTCAEVDDPSTLPAILPELIGSTLDSLEIEVDGGGATPIDNADIDPDLPQDGPVSATYTTTVSGLGPGDHDICVTANGSDAGGTGSVTECVTIHVIVEVPIDVKPASDPNSINLKSRGTIPVAILGTDAFDPATADQASLTFGRTGDEDSLAFCTRSVEDVNGDGLLDQVCHFNTQDTGFECGDAVGILRGQTLDGVPMEGRDSVRIVPCH